MTTRRASHAGSWYSDSGEELNSQLKSWLNAAELSHGPARAIISPHAGYTYCGACAAYAYRQINPAIVKRVFILGPSHHVRLRGCALTTAKTYETPLYDLTIDAQTNRDLEKTGHFSWMEMKTDEDEHSIEMQLPYIAKVMEDFRDQFSVVPILVGSLSAQQEALYGSILCDYFKDPQNLFVISSDFCHWGNRFGYTHYDRSCGAIYKSIEQLDMRGMDIIESLEHTTFSEYLRKYGNTICGRHPIGVMLGAIKCLRDQGFNALNFKFLKYAQSSQCRFMHDSSVSYASGALIFKS